MQQVFHYDNYYDDYEPRIEFRDCHFYTSINYLNRGTITDWNDFFVPYTYKKAYWDTRDIVDHAIYTIETYESKLHAYSLCENIGIKLSELEIVFNINNITVYANNWGQYELFAKKHLDYGMGNVSAGTQLVNDEETEFEISMVRNVGGRVPAVFDRDSDSFGFQLDNI